MIISIILILFTCGLSGCFEPQATEYFNKDLEASENTILTATTINGQIEISVWGGDTISINAVKKSAFGKEELDKIEINIEENENQIDIEALYEGDRTTTPSVDMNIKVPEGVAVKSATTSNGAIQISGTKGDVVATTSNGAIVIENVVGYVSAITSNGRIEVTGTTGILGSGGKTIHIQTSNGNIFLKKLEI